MVHLQSQDLCSVSIFSFATTRHRLRLLLLLRKIRQQHPAAKVAACNGTSMPTPKRTRHSDRARAAATAGQLQSAPRVVWLLKFETFWGYMWVKILRGGCGETLNQGPRIIPANHTPESYPESYPRIIPPRQTSRKGRGIL